MFTYNGFKKKRCFLEGDNVVIDGENYPIQNIKEIENPEYRIYFLVIVMIVFTLFLCYTGSMAYKEQIADNPDLTDKIFCSAILLFGLIAWFILWWLIIKLGFIDCSNCRSFLTVNGNKGLYIEKDDDLTMEARLKEIKYKVSNSSTILHSAGDKTKNSITNEIKFIIWGSIALIFPIILYLGFKGYIKGGIFIPLVLFVAAIIIVLRFWQLKEEFNNLRWKK